MRLLAHLAVFLHFAFGGFHVLVGFLGLFLGLGLLAAVLLYALFEVGNLLLALGNMLDSLGVQSENIAYDDFGGGAPKK